jgi:hypothetical protein
MYVLTGNICYCSYLGCTQEYSICISPSTAGLGMSGSPSLSLGVSFKFLPGMVKDQETVDQESS